MANKQMIAPCGMDCASCVHYLANDNPAALVQVEKWSALLNIPIEIITCKGCWAHSGQIPLQKHLFGDNHRCSIYGCAQGKKTEYCGLCEQFPCDKRHPYLEKNELLNKNAKALLCP
jgi:hypothetical protein